MFLEQGKKCGGVREKCVIKFDDVSVVKSKLETVIEIMEENGVHIHDGWIRLACKQINKELLAGLCDIIIGVYTITFYVVSNVIKRITKTKLVKLYVCDIMYFIQ